MLRQTEVKNGKIKGFAATDPRVTVYKGVPFAAAPTGSNRWRAPQPCADWEGVLEAKDFGPISVQDTPGLGDDIYCREWHVDPEIAMSEDFLYLNIWTPAKEKDEKLPVLVWFFGGAFQWGYTAEMEFNGEQLAKHGVIVATVGYRLNCFGFLAHPDITKQSPEAPSNFGLLDQQAGLKWVYDNNEFSNAGVNMVELSVKRTFEEAHKNDPDQHLYYYRFDPDIPGDGHSGDSYPGTFHSCDLWFFFNSIDKCNRPYEDGTRLGEK